jgi:hypothetical protein
LFEYNTREKIKKASGVWITYRRLWGKGFRVEEVGVRREN